MGILGLGVVEARELVRMAALCSLATKAVLLPIQIGLFVLLGGGRPVGVSRTGGERSI